jgi:hypothetical protein
MRTALDAAERVKGRRPDLRPTESDFEWGMWNGKLSALRWVLGSEWDFLDTYSAAGTSPGSGDPFGAAQCGGPWS